MGKGGDVEGVGQGSRVGLGLSRHKKGGTKLLSPN